MAASAGKQLHNRMQNQTCLQRRAGGRARGETGRVLLIKCVKTQTAHFNKV